MQKLLCFLVLFLGAQAATAQATKAPLQDLSGVTASIMSKLSSNLSLTDVQKPKLTTLVSNFLAQKAGFAPLKDQNPTAYAKKLTSMQHGLYNHFKTTLNTDQYTQFMALKPPTDDVTNVLSKLFY